MANMHQQNLLESISGLLNNKHYSDLTIDCGGRQFHALKAIVCSVSPVLARECNSGMQEDQTKHDTFNADTVERMLSYIYRQTYDVKGEDAIFDECTMADATNEEEAAWGFVPDSHKVLVAHADVFGIADYYSLPTLGALSVQRFRDVARCGVRADNFIEVIKAVDERDNSLSRDLRDALRECAMDNRARLIRNDAFMLQLGVQDFAADMFRHTVERQIEMRDEMNARVQSARTKLMKLEKELRAEITVKDAQIEAHEVQREHVAKVTRGLAATIDKLPKRCHRKACRRVLGENLYIVQRDVDEGPGMPYGSWKIFCGACNAILA